MLRIIVRQIAFQEVSLNDLEGHSVLSNAWQSLTCSPPGTVSLLANSSEIGLLDHHSAVSSNVTPSGERKRSNPNNDRRLLICRPTCREVRGYWTESVKFLHTRGIIAILSAEIGIMIWQSILVDQCDK